MYNGEVFIAQEELTTFLETARELKVIGLQAEVQCMGQNEPEEKMSTAQNEYHFSKETKQDIVNKKSSFQLSIPNAFLHTLMHNGMKATRIIHSMSCNVHCSCL